MDGRTGRLPLEWNDAKSFLTLLVIPTLEEPDMVLGMDVLQRLWVRIDTKTGTVQPTMLVTKIKPEESCKVPARTSVVFSNNDPYGEQEKKEKHLVSIKRETTADAKGDNIIGARTTAIRQARKYGRGESGIRSQLGDRYSGSR